MKSIHNLTPTNQEKEKILTVGNSWHPVKAYKKTDFLSPVQVGKKFNITTEQATGIMKKMAFNRVIFALNGHKTPVIVKFNSHVRLHPMAIEAFEQYIQNKR